MCILLTLICYQKYISGVPTSVLLIEVCWKQWVMNYSTNHWRTVVYRQRIQWLLYPLARLIRTNYCTSFFMFVQCTHDRNTNIYPACSCISCTLTTAVDGVSFWMFIMMSRSAKCCLYSVFCIAESSRMHLELQTFGYLTWRGSW